MSSDAIVVLCILGATIVLFVLDRLPIDLVALLALVALWVTGVLTPAEGLAGFANPVVLMIAGLFVVGAALMNSGVAGWLGGQLRRFGGTSEMRLILVIMVMTAVLSGFMSSTGTVAILLPVVVTVAKRARVSPARLLIPLSFSSLLGGMLTLIGTPPNIVVNSELVKHGGTSFGFFSFTPAGVVMLIVGVGFMVLVGRKLLPGGSTQDEEAGPHSISQNELASDYQLPGQLRTVRVQAGSPLAGQEIRAANLRHEHGLTVVGVRRSGSALHVLPTLVLEAGDVLRLQSSSPDDDVSPEELGLEELPDRGDVMLPPEEALAEVVLPRRSKFLGRTLHQLRFRDRYRATVLAVQRRGKTLPLPVGNKPLRHGDTLLVKGRLKHVRHLADEPRNFVLLTETRGAEAVVDPRYGPLSIALTLGMLLLMTLRVVPNVVAVVLAGTLMVLTRCLTTAEAYRRINWESVVVIAAMLPMATALDKTGAMGVVVDFLVKSLGGHGPLVMMAVLFVITSTFSQVISNTATTVLVAPIAYRIATDLGVAPHPMLMAVAIAASTAFATPIASPVNTLVLNAGGYKFGDFFKVGVALQLLILAATLLILPVLFPFSP